MNKQEMKKHCEEHMHRYVLVTTKDQQQFDAILESVDDENVSFAVPLGGHMMQETMMPTSTNGGFGYGYNNEFEQRQFNPYYGYQPYSYYPPYPLYPPYPYYRPRRFQRLVLPLAALVALSTLPYF
ncbi:hypothetical protein CR194_00730 [Salipaludibacillus keqinensis]|uniref:Uncharacterized protein n=1 Tax=Salipaludibacillus keqinensis TaxID=2045207 RepID=A0A323THV5_9BACI|nr:hypothetical protein [Salipaludibacillus keqinensis]PYZ94100.1 hypothetical protein CR194_00730 [Salipaludibacillus keqinensis]